MMKDCKDNCLSIGDLVVYVQRKSSTASLDTGYITNIYKNRYGEYECSVGKQAHILSNRVMKLNY